MANDSNFMDDFESLQTLVKLAGPDIEVMWDNHKHLAKEAAFPGRKLVVYTLENGKPEDIEIISLSHLHVGSESGPWIEIVSNRREDKQYVSTVPTRVYDRDLLILMPQKFEVRWSGRHGRTGVNFAAHYALLTKSRDKPDLKRDGGTYCLSFNKFRQMFPDLDFRY